MKAICLGCKQKSTVLYRVYIVHTGTCLVLHGGPNFWKAHVFVSVSLQVWGGKGLLNRNKHVHMYIRWTDFFGFSIKRVI